MDSNKYSFVSNLNDDEFKKLGATRIIRIGKCDMFGFIEFPESEYSKIKMYCSKLQDETSEEWNKIIFSTQEQLKTYFVVLKSDIIQDDIPTNDIKILRITTRGKRTEAEVMFLQDKPEQFKHLFLTCNCRSSMYRCIM
jgi:hypothetical protein